MKLITCTLISSATLLQAQPLPIPAHKLYADHCAACHGKKLDGGNYAGTLLKQEWWLIDKESSFLEFVRNGDLDLEMPAFKASLTDKEIRSLEKYILHFSKNKKVSTVTEQ